MQLRTTTALIQILLTLGLLTAAPVLAAVAPLQPPIDYYHLVKRPEGYLTPEWCVLPTLKRQVAPLRGRAKKTPLSLIGKVFKINRAQEARSTICYRHCCCRCYPGRHDAPRYDACCHDVRCHDAHRYVTYLGCREGMDDDSGSLRQRYCYGGGGGAKGG
ncbi:hypothetical protein NpPPO83_00004325 [Neofusicoccum parvum]|uniref:Uncharacterized protein n=1 Tax=Neofusicoccum parvum TaxID=310453 RepID=A0ACB5S9L0_9PEZI|nr:hypothetical protein NpPPO83_00004325 [Neofusicoccum parvum]